MVQSQATTHSFTDKTATMAEQNQKYPQFRGQPRLPKFAIPKRYDLKLNPDLAACKFTGAVQISVHVVSDTKFLVLNAAELSVTSNSVKFASANKVNWREIVLFAISVFIVGLGINLAKSNSVSLMKRFILIAERFSARAL